jgi:hypothetical protein
MKKLRDYVVSAKFNWRQPIRHRGPGSSPETVGELFPLNHRNRDPDQLSEPLPEGAGFVSFAGFSGEPYG